VGGADVTNLITRLRDGARGISTVEDLAQALSVYNAGWQQQVMPGGLTQTLTGEPAEEIARNFVSYTRQAYADNGIVFACMLARMSVFSAARFRWQRLRDGKPSDTFGNSDLEVLERPWVGGTTQDLLSRMIQDADLAGNAFFTRFDDGIVRLRPDWIDIVVAKRLYRGGQVGHVKVGYLYYEGGKERCKPEEAVPFFPEEVAHFMPTPDPQASFRGMSWLTPVVREVQNDGLMNRHKKKFFENGATPNLVIKHAQAASPEKVERFAERMAAQYGGVDNAYKSLNLYPGADVTVVGSDFRQVDFKQVQGAGETRIAAAAGVPPVIAGFSEGLQSATYSNYGQARRRFGDATIHPLWQNAAGSTEPLLPRPGNFGTGRDVRLWYDVSDVPFLREDAKDQSEIAFQRAQTIRQYVDSGFTPESAVAAVNAQDERLLVHTGLFSVQLQEPGSQQEAPAPQQIEAGQTESSGTTTQGA
jgi:phage portal protein BeeE